MAFIQGGRLIIILYQWNEYLKKNKAIIYYREVKYVMWLIIFKLWYSAMWVTIPSLHQMPRNSYPFCRIPWLEIMKPQINVALL